MIMKLRNRQKGFTLIELLIVIAIIGIIAALLIPNFLDALNKGKQKRSMGEMRNWGSAIMTWLTDQSGAAAAGAATTVSVSSWTASNGGDTIDGLQSALVPQYIQEIPAVDGWKNDLTFAVDLGDPNALNFALVASGGRDGSAVTGTYTVGGFDPTDYDQDIIWADGSFIRRPDKAAP